MNENIPTSPGTINSGRLHLDYDWYSIGLPANVELGENVYIDTSYGFAHCFSEQQPGIVIGEATGAYDRTGFIVGPQGCVRVGAYTVLNGTYLICNDRIEIGNHCLLAWGSVITDTWPEQTAAIAARRQVLQAAAADPWRRLQPVTTPQPVILEDNSWVGFDAVILPGVRLGRGCVVGSKTIIYENVPPYAVVVGDPARIVRYLEPNDTDAVRQQALQEYRR